MLTCPARSILGSVVALRMKNQTTKDFLASNGTQKGEQNSCLSLSEHEELWLTTRSVAAGIQLHRVR